MTVKKEDINFIRERPWPNTKLELDKKTIDEAIAKLELTNCPVCTTELKSQDNFGHPLTDFASIKERYCPKCDYIIELSTHNYEGNTYGAHLFINIYTNCAHKKRIARSGVLAEFKDHINLH